MSTDDPSRDLARQQMQALLERGHAESGYDDVRHLSLYGDDGEDDEDRVDCISTITAGRKNERGLPEPARDQRIVHHDKGSRAPGLEAALKATGYKTLRIAFRYDDTRRFVKTRYVLYKASKLEARGTATYMIEFKPNGDRVKHPVGTPGYNAILAREGMKVETWVYFHLAEMVEIEVDGKMRKIPMVVFPDGQLPYRLKFTGENSAKALESSIRYLRGMTGGPIAGLHFELSIDLKNLTDGRGQKHDNTVVWSFTPRAALNSFEWTMVAAEALNQGRILKMLPPPPVEPGEEAEEPPVAEGEYREVSLGEIRQPTADDLRIMEGGGLCDADAYRRAYFAEVNGKGTDLDTDDGRHAYVAFWSDGRWNSLSTALSQMTQKEADKFIEDVRDQVRLMTGDTVPVVSGPGATTEQPAPPPAVETAATPLPAATVEPVAQVVTPPVDDNTEVQVGDKPAADLEDLMLEARLIGIPSDAIDKAKPEYPSTLGIMRTNYRALLRLVKPLRTAASTAALVAAKAELAAEAAARAEHAAEMAATGAAGDETEEELLALASAADEREETPAF